MLTGIKASDSNPVMKIVKHRETGVELHKLMCFYEVFGPEEEVEDFIEQQMSVQTASGESFYKETEDGIPKFWGEYKGTEVEIVYSDKAERYFAQESEATLLARSFAMAERNAAAIKAARGRKKVIEHEAPEDGPAANSTVEDGAM